MIRQLTSKNDELTREREREKCHTMQQKKTNCEKLQMNFGVFGEII